MNLARIGRGMVVLALLGACASAPAEADRSQSIVISKYAPHTEFTSYKTFYLRPEIRTVDDDGELAPVSPSKAQPILNETRQNLLARGYIETTKDSADLGVELIYTEHISSTYWCYSWWDPYYWGYPPYWGYYPYYGCDATMWKSNMLSTTITDLTQNQRVLGPGGGEGGADGAAGSSGSGANDKVAGVWFSGVYGVSLTAQAALDGIDQAFKQSPYLKAAP